MQAATRESAMAFYIVLLIYLGIMAFIGWYAGRKTKNLGDFFVLSGKAGMVVSGIAYFSTQFSMGTFLGTPGTIYGVGYAGMAISVPGAVFCMILPAVLVGRKLITLGHTHGFLTMADYLTDRYHTKTMSGVLGVMMLFFLVPMMGAQIIGAGVIVLPGVTIGDNSVIGAGSIVTKDIPSNVIAVGNPCRALREISDHDREYYFKDKKIDQKIRSMIQNETI